MKSQITRITEQLEQLPASQLVELEMQVNLLVAQLPEKRRVSRLSHSHHSHSPQGFISGLVGWGEEAAHL